MIYNIYYTFGFEIAIYKAVRKKLGKIITKELFSSAQKIGKKIRIFIKQKQEWLLFPRFEVLDINDEIYSLRYGWIKTFGIKLGSVKA